MTRLMTLFLISAIILTGFVLPVRQTLDPTTPDYYVSASGNDLNDGSFASPFRTLAKAVSVLQAGDTLRVMEGTYNETLKVDKIGTAAFPITILGSGAYLDGEGVIQNVVDTPGDYIIIDGFEIVRAKGFGIFNTGSHNIFQYNVLHDNVTSNMVNGKCNNDAVAGWGSAAKDKVGADNSIYRFNAVYSNCGEGIAITRGVVSLVEGNIVSDNFVVGIYVDNSNFVTVINNVIFCTVNAPTWYSKIMHAVAIGEEFYSGWGAQLHDVLITGNTMRDCQTGVQGIASSVGGTYTNITFDGNTVFSATKRSISWDVSKSLNVKFINNFLYALDWWLKSLAGVTLSGNTLIGVTTPTPILPTFTGQPPTVTMTFTLAPPTFTRSPTPTRTPTATNTPILPTGVTPPTATAKTPTSTPTKTFTPIPATPTPSSPCDPVYVPFGVCIYILP